MSLPDPDAAPALRLAFFGTPAFAVPALEALRRSRHAVVGVVTQPDRPRGRGQRVVEGPVRRIARTHGIPLVQPEARDTPTLLAALGSWAIELGVVVAYGRLLPSSVLALPRLGFVNLHASLLPKYRGAAPIQRAVMAGESETGVTVMRIVPELDAGPVLATARCAIPPERTSPELADDLAALGAPLLVSTVDALAEGRAVETPQEAAQATYAPRLTRAEGPIDWTLGAQAIHDRIRGLQPWPHAWTVLEGTRYLLLDSRVEPEAGADTPEPASVPGTILIADRSRLLVQAGGGTRLALLRLQPEGRAAMDAAAWLAGRRGLAGSVFGRSTLPAP